MNHTPTIALGIAAMLLLIVGALSYKNSVRSSMEKEFAEKEARLMQRLGYPEGAPVQPAATASALKAATAPSATPLAGTVLYDAQGNPVYLTGTPPPSQAAVAQTEVSLPAPEDPDIARLQKSLDQAREQSQVTEQRFNQLAGGETAATREAKAVAEAGLDGGAGTVPGPGAGGSAAITSELPDFLRNAVENPPGGNPEVEAKLDRMRAQVMAAPSLAKVKSYDKEWGIVTFNAGSAQGVKVDQRFAVRRGTDVLGWVKVSEVQEDQAIATLVTKNRDSDTALKPDVGDDLIDFELF